MFTKNYSKLNKKGRRPKPTAPGISIGYWKLYESEEGDLVAYNSLSGREVILATQF